MKTKQEARAELLEMLGIDAILLALSEFCFGKEEHCEDCQYLNKDGSCQVFKAIDRTGVFPNPAEIPVGDNWEERDE